MESHITLDSLHEFYFNSSGPVTALSLADNLIGLEGVASTSAKVMARIAGVKVTDSEVIIQEISLHSYKDKFLFRLFFGEGKAAEEKLEKFREALKIKNMDANALAKFCIAGAIAFAAWKLSSPEDDSASTPQQKEAQIAFHDSFNNMTIAVGIDKEEALAVFEKALKNPEPLKKKVIKLTRPAGQELAGSISIDGSDTFKIPQKLIEAIPVDYQKPDLDEPEKEFPSIDVILRAVDLDRPGTGWWVIVPEISESRLSVTLDEGLNPDSLPVGKLFKGRITVTYKKGRHGEKIPKSVLLTEKL